MNLKLFIPPKDNEVYPQINRDAFSSYNDLTTEFKNVKIGLFACPLECNIIYELLCSRLKQIGDAIKTIETKKELPSFGN